MNKRKFRIIFSGEAEIELDDAVIAVVDDEWRSYLYNLKTPEEIASHIGYNFIFNNARLSMLDGWADQPDSNVKYEGLDDLEIEAKELADD